MGHLEKGEHGELIFTITIIIKFLTTQLLEESV